MHDVRYVACQPWPFPASLMLGFVARLDGDPSITLDPVEMAEADWFTREEIARPPTGPTRDSSRPGTAAAASRRTSRSRVSHRPLAGRLTRPRVSRPGGLLDAVGVHPFWVDADERCRETRAERFAAGVDRFRPTSDLDHPR